jgi:hypothetical protein
MEALASQGGNSEGQAESTGLLILGWLFTPHFLNDKLKPQCLLIFPEVTLSWQSHKLELLNVKVEFGVDSSPQRKLQQHMIFWPSSAPPKLSQTNMEFHLKQGFGAVLMDHQDDTFEAAFCFLTALHTTVTIPA